MTILFHNTGFAFRNAMRSMPGFKASDAITKAEPDPKHGEEKLHHMENINGHRVNVRYRYCARCGRWILLVGFTGSVRWAEHQRHGT